MQSFILSSIVLLCGAASGVMAAPSAPASSNVTVNTIGTNGTASNGAGSLSASGSLAPFGDIGVGCGINWAEGSSFGGGLQAGSPAFGLGGGYTISTSNMTIGLGTGNVKTNTKADLAFTLGYDGAAEFKITYSGKLSCQESTDGTGASVFTCTGAK
ncbi:hypothetical protein PG997_002110 [Apiospora hydei]|uniref:Uncharacterized protein n=1 Tax=Apiospora hydei TaxID=1337664 RepID=A0ABR1X8F1_9PEZI